MSTLLDNFSSLLNHSLVGKISSLYNAEESKIKKGAMAYAGTILAGFASKADDFPFLDKAFGLLNDSSMSYVLEDPGALVHAGNIAHHDPKDTAGKVLGMLFGEKIPSMIDGMAAHTGLKQSDSSHLLGIVSPIVMALLSKKILTEELNTSSFARFLSAEKSSFLALVPAGISSLFGWHSHMTTHESQTPGNKGWIWIVLLLIALLLAFFLMKGCNQQDATPSPSEIDTTSQVTAADTLQYVKQLSSGQEIKGNLGGIEDSLIAFIESDRPVDKTTWFSFDRLTFKTDSTEVDMDKSAPQLHNIVYILQAFPNVKLKIGGYADATGDEGHNRELSQQRAKHVEEALISLGVDANRLDAEGYGSQYPVATNETAMGRAQNRRIDVRVTEK